MRSRHADRCAANAGAPERPAVIPRRATPRCLPFSGPTRSASRGCPEFVRLCPARGPVHPENGSSAGCAGQESCRSPARPRARHASAASEADGHGAVYRSQDQRMRVRRSVPGFCSSRARAGISLLRTVGRSENGGPAEEASPAAAAGWLTRTDAAPCEDRSRTEGTTWRCGWVWSAGGSWRG